MPIPKTGNHVKASFRAAFIPTIGEGSCLISHFSFLASFIRFLLEKNCSL